MKRFARLAAQAILPAVILTLAYLATDALLNADPEGPAISERAEEVFAVTATAVTVGDHRATLRAFGEVVAADIAELRVASPGRVVGFHPLLAVGNVVDAGAALVTIDPFEYEGALREARAALLEAEARLAEADARIALEETALERAAEQAAFAATDLERAEVLRARGSISEKALDDRKMLVSERSQAVDQRRHLLDAERARRDQQAAAVERLAWQVEKAERALEDTVLRAPFTGIVREEIVATGKMLSASDVAVSLIRAGALEARFVLSDQRYGRLIAGRSLIGAPVEVIWRIGDEPLTYSARISRIAADIASDTGGVAVFAKLDLPDQGAVPRPGAFVEVSVPGRLHENTVRLPDAALYDGHVFVIAKDDRLRMRPVTLLARDRDGVIVRGRLDEGLPVVTTRLAEAGEGLLVRRVEEAPAPVTEPDSIATTAEAADPLAPREPAPAATEAGASRQPS